MTEGSLSQASLQTVEKAFWDIVYVFIVVDQNDELSFHAVSLHFYSHAEYLLFYFSPAISSKVSSSMTLTPSFCALTSLEPAFSPATT